MGPGYQTTTFKSVDVNSSKSVSTPIVFFDTRYEQEITSDIDFLLNYNIYLANDDSGRYVHHVEISLQTELVANFTMDFSLFWDRVETPSAFDDGTVPKKDDYKSMIAIGYSY